MHIVVVCACCVYVCVCVLLFLLICLHWGCFHAFCFLPFAFCHAAWLWVKFGNGAALILRVLKFFSFFLVLPLTRSPAKFGNVAASASVYFYCFACDAWLIFHFFFFPFFFCYPLLSICISPLCVFLLPPLALWLLFYFVLRNFLLNFRSLNSIQFSVCA